MSKIKLNIRYVHSDDDINKDVDKAIEKALSDLGYDLWATGYDLVDEYRELCFEKDKSDGK